MRVGVRLAIAVGVAVTAVVGAQVADIGIYVWDLLLSMEVVPQPACPDVNPLSPDRSLCTTPTSLVITRLVTSLLLASLGGMAAYWAAGRVRHTRVTR